MRRHMTTYVHAMWCMRMHVYVRMCTYVCACVITELSILFRIFANSLITYNLYNHQFTLIFSMWDYFCLFLRTGDVAHSRACYRANKL